MATWKRDFASGLIVLTPILVTLLVVYWLYGRIADLPIVRQVPDPFGALIAVSVFVMLVFSVGYLMRTTAGRLVEDRLDTAMNRVPLIRVLYNASKLAVETAVSGTDDLQKPVRIETWQGLRMTAFQTGQRTDDDREVLFLPTAPNITTGFVVEVESDRIEPTGESVEQALTRILSAGFAEEETVDRIEKLGPSPEVIGGGEGERSDGPDDSSESREAGSEDDGAGESTREASSEDDSRN
jgi:uncharacterized membrane protein